MEMFNNIDKTFATRATAVSKAEGLITELDLPETRYVIAVSEAGRFFPVFILSGREQQRMMDFVNRGYCIAG
jgi:hypothetical protein